MKLSTLPVPSRPQDPDLRYTSFSNMAMKFNIRTEGSINGGGRSAAGKGCMTLFFLVFLLMGAGFTVVIALETVREAAVWFWPEAPCRILESGVEETGDDSDPYRPGVRFEYEADGRIYEGREVSRADTETSSYDSARRTLDRYPAGTRSTCRINPDDPGDAVLERRLPFIALVMFLPLIFVAVGAGGIYGVWKPERSLDGGSGVRSISQRARKGSGKTIELVVGLIFTAIGGVISFFLLAVPLFNLLQASTWTEVPASVTSSNVRSWSTDDGTSYRADVLYEYQAADRSWISNRRSFFPMSSTDYDDSRAVVERYPEGHDTTCFVDPDNPGKSVLDRDFHPVYLVGFFPMVFLLVGLALIVHSRKTPNTSSSPMSTPQGRPEPVAAEAVLQPEAGPIAKVFGMLFFALFWNGIVSVFIWQVVKSFRQGSPEWFLTVFLIPFVLVGLGLVFGVFYFLLATVNPRPRLVIAPSAPRLGRRLRLEWEFSGKVERLDTLKIVLEGHEKATYRRGTDTHTDRNVFASMKLIDTDLEWEIPRGTAEVEIPPDTMHSFASTNNAVVWSIHVHGEISRWPDVIETFELEVRPMSRKELLP